MKTQYGTLLKSDNALNAESENRFPIGAATKKLKSMLAQNGIKATLRSCRSALEAFGDQGEWHHVSKFANEISYYDVASVLEMLDEPKARQKLLELLQKPAKASVATATTVHVVIAWSEWVGSAGKRKQVEHEWIGTAVVKGDWIHFDGRRKKLSGNWIALEHISKAKVKAHQRRVAREQERIAEEERLPFKELQQSIQKLESDVLINLWKKRQGGNRKMANRRLREATGLTVDRAYLTNLKWGWRFVEEAIQSSD